MPNFCDSLPYTALPQKHPHFCFFQVWSTKERQSASIPQRLTGHNFYLQLSFQRKNSCEVTSSHWKFLHSRIETSIRCLSNYLLGSPRPKVIWTQSREWGEVTPAPPWTTRVSGHRPVYVKAFSQFCLEIWNFILTLAMPLKHPVWILLEFVWWA